MRTKTKAISFKLTPAERSCLDDLLRLRHYTSQSEAIRAALSLLFNHHQVKPEAVKAMASERRIHRPRYGKFLPIKLDREPAFPDPKAAGR